MSSGRGSNCWLTKMDGAIVAVVHDEFRGMGLSGIRGFLGAGAVVVAGVGGVSQLQCDNEYNLRK